MKIERITKEQAEVIARRFEEVLRATARRMGELTVKAENVKFALWCQYDGDDDRLIGDTVDRWDFTEVYMNKTFGVTRLSVLRELMERFRRTEPSPENVRDVADALKRLSMEPRSEKLRIAVVEQLRRVLR